MIYRGKPVQSLTFTGIVQSDRSRVFQRNFSRRITLVLCEERGANPIGRMIEAILRFSN